MRQLGLATVLVIAAVSVLIAPRQAPAPDNAIELTGSSAAVCSVEEGSGRSTVVAVASSVDGPARLEVFAGGRAAGAADGATVGGSASFTVGDVAAVGIAGALGELPSADSAASSMVRGEQSLAVEVCPDSPSAQVVVAGGSTRSGEAFFLHLMNPYSTGARVELTVTSEAGLESNDRFESISIPSDASVVLDMGQIIPGREVIAVTVDSLSGNVIAAGRQESAGDNALWSGVPAGQDWFIPIGASLRAGRVLVVSPVNAPVEFQLDLYSDEGFEENFVTGTIPERGHVWVDLSEALGDAIAARVITATPVVATIVSSGENRVAVTNGLTVASTAWLVPGAGSLDAVGENLVILNPGLDTATVTIRALGGSASAGEFDLPADSVAEVGAEGGNGYLVRATTEIVVLWIAIGERSLSVTGGEPLDEG